MSDKTLIKLFDEKQVRIVWDEQEKKYYFSIVDVVQVLTESTDYQTARKYWNKLKQRLKEEGNEMVTCHQLKLAGGKMFVRVAGPGTIAAHKCWLELDNAKAARQLNIGNDEPTGIDRIDNSQLTIDNYSGVWFDLQGKKLEGKPKRKGVYIRNGKKIAQSRRER